jgi:hypothetical protein
MIERVLNALRILAAEPETQVSRYAEWTCRPDRIGPELEDALLLLDSCQQLTETDDQREALARVEEALEAAEGPEFWTERAVRTDPHWAEVRSRARAALRMLGAREG